VGVSWDQATEYARWRTDRVNEMILVERGILELNTEQKDDDNFNTESYLLGLYQGTVRKNLKDLRTGGERPVHFEDGQGELATEQDERITDRRIYSWPGNTVRYQRHGKYQGAIMANFKRGGGDYMGLAGHLNDRAHIPAPVRTFFPNDFGLYNMAGNVSEWTADVYRPLRLRSRYG